MATFADGKFGVDCSTVVETGLSEGGDGKGEMSEEVRDWVVCVWGVWGGRET